MWWWLNCMDCNKCRIWVIKIWFWCIYLDMKINLLIRDWRVFFVVVCLCNYVCNKLLSLDKWFGFIDKVKVIVFSLMFKYVMIGEGG